MPDVPSANCVAPRWKVSTYHQQPGKPSSRHLHSAAPNLWMRLTSPGSRYFAGSGPGVLRSCVVVRWSGSSHRCSPASRDRRNGESCTDWIPQPEIEEQPFLRNASLHEPIHIKEVADGVIEMISVIGPGKQVHSQNCESAVLPVPRNQPCCGDPWDKIFWALSEMVAIPECPNGTLAPSFGSIWAAART